MNPPQQPQTPAPDVSALKPDIVTSIPLKVQDATAQPPHKDAEIDKIMHDVGQELKKNVKHTTRHGLFSISKRSKQPQAQAAPPRPVIASQVTNQQPIPQSQPTASTQAKPQVKPKSDTKQSVPIFMILVTLIVTSALIVVAVATYNRQ
jgi:hypothetical protein